MEELDIKSSSDMSAPAFLFTVIIPVYNTEKYLETTIQSVISQNIGFRENIQLILVNNATEDGAGEICERYRDIYPNNITYIALSENVGPNGARNAGVPYIKGAYVNFLDSDDKWAKNAFSKVLSFFRQHEEEIDCVACRVRSFGATNEWHPLDYIFKQTRIVNIEDEYDCIQTRVASAFIRAQTIRDNAIDTEIQRTEDSKYMLQLILKSGKYGVLRSAVYYYRRHAGSTMNAMEKRRLFYVDVLEQYHWYFIREALEKGERLSRYAQYMLMYDIQWRLKVPAWDGLTQEEMRGYQKNISDILAYIDDDIICSQRNVWKEHKIFALSLKYKRDIRKEWLLKKGSFYFHNIKLYDLRDKMNLEVKILKIEYDMLILEGQANYPLMKNSYQIVAKDNQGREFKAEMFVLGDKKRRVALGIEYHCFWGFTIKIPLESVSWLQLFVYCNGLAFAQKLRLGWLVPLSDTIPYSHHESGKYMIRAWKSKDRLIIKSNTREERFKTECRYLWQLLKGKHRRMFLFRIIMAPFMAWKRISKKQFWLFADRIHTADDNAEYLYQYVLQHPSPQIKPYYVLAKNSPDYKRVSMYGKVVAYRSIRFYILFVLSDYIVSSIMDRYFYHSFGVHHEFIKDTLHSKWIYLQHCVNKDDLTDIYHKLRLNMSMFITSAIPEDISMRTLPYGYSPDEIKLLGMPRYDILYPCRSVQPEKLICIAPTWRFNLTTAGGINHKEGQYPYSEKFKQSDFFRFYNALINEPRILNVMSRRGYHGVLRLHPAAAAQIQDFHFSDLFSAYNGKLSYQDQFAKCALLVTDYSSIAMDYAFVGRAVIYAQFDADTFYQGHIYQKGYFDYKENGFGPVCFDYETTVIAIIQAIELDCKVEPCYQARASKFFAFQDQNNCQRIYEAILNDSKE